MIQDNKKILILGCHGMLGTDLAHALASSAELYLWDKEELDVTSEKLVQIKIESLQPDIIINATGFTDVDGAENNKEMAFKINAEAVGYLVQAAGKIQAKLVHFSTEHVFSGEDEIGYDENSVPSPINIYGQSKLDGEKFVTEYNNGYLIRTSWLYGHALQLGKPRGLNFIDTMLKLGSEQAEVKVVNDQFGKLTYTKDLAQAVKNLIKGDYQPGIYHLVNEEAASWYAIAHELFKLKNIKIKLTPITSADYLTPARRPKKAILLNTKFPVLRPWREALREYLQKVNV